MSSFYSILFILVFSFLNSACAQKSYKRTDGPAGSEWGDFPNTFDGEVQAGVHFGAQLNTDDSDRSSFGLGADLDYRPDDLFGVKLLFLQGLDDPSPSLISVTPLLHTQYSNLRPFAYFGPGIGVVKSSSGDRGAKFGFMAGAGADFQFTDHLGLGILWQYNILFDSQDFQHIGARIYYSTSMW